MNLPAGASLQGNGDGWISSVSPIQNAHPEALVWINPARKDQHELLGITRSNCIVVGTSEVYQPRENQLLIRCEDPRFFYASLLSELIQDSTASGIHSTAIVDERAVIGERVSIGAYTVIGECTIGDGVRIGSHCHIKDGAAIGKRVTIADGVIVGGDGFGFVKQKNGEPFRFPHVGSVIIEDDVEIGSNTCVDRGTLGSTIIRFFAKIDNLVHIAHNVDVGARTMIAANAMIGGSTVLGEDVWIAPSVTVRDGLSIGDKSFIGLGAVLTKSVPEGEVWAGSPARFLRRS